MKKVGILGGGQLGRMLLQEAANYPVETWVMENDAECPAAHLCHKFIVGDIRNFEDVYRFGKQVEALTIEIESVNVDALEQLEKEGITVIPKPSALRTIKNKIRQKEFYQALELPTAPFIVTQNKTDLYNHRNFFPAAHKLGEGGYDGKGVQLINTADEISLGFDAPSVLEKKINISKEISVIVAIDSKGSAVMYPPVEMVFDPNLNLLDYQISPADIPEKTKWRLEAIARKLAIALASPGLFAVELFVDTNGDVLVNETAPRVHNSGHHTIEAHYSSQYDMLWRILLDYPLGSPAAIMASSLVNLIGEKGHSGPAVYEGIEDVLALEDCYIHLYGKKETRPGRKMGHITIVGKDRHDLVRKAHQVKRSLRVISKP
ncbi:5-(carboxyamino)imidazole ribonucleotide synthase [Flavihumibacter profundi]|jgi:5-(carboxyamino)imidazole ribonucleotide synthase|uniref:5-(carboxyamino)imidazole ribonucleotide synthase n=1 Tax=Flavihumibacter profundi TaxID=2716883 RepID=UPI001CC61165|nr:5-(carboxyamino)imidazole ribonucleotide synthase [Flavihumibacter profundi]MBZ5855871.1 5-(carboxyamino)imidazole ribonucleotide synthase [Flavihumibacter profundi]